MAMERASLSDSLGVGQTTPLSPVLGEQGQASPGAGERKPRRREPLPEETSGEPPAEDTDQPPHRIDSLA